MKTRYKRLLLVMLGLSMLAAATALVLSAFQKNLVFFFSPSQILTGEAPRAQRFRLGGMVEASSLRRQADGLTVKFVVTDMAHSVPVQYRGILPDLFREGKGVVAAGKLDGDGVFVADEVLAKHNENYMPPEAADALRKGQAAVLKNRATALKDIP
jgi:cytochrome c-type biogenesis protein CcmE